MNNANQALSEGDGRFPRLLVPADMQIGAMALGIDAQASIDRFMGRAALTLRMSKSFMAASESLVTEFQAMQLEGRLARAAARLHAFKRLAGTLALPGLPPRGDAGEAGPMCGEPSPSTWTMEMQHSIRQDWRTFLEQVQGLQALERAKESQSIEADGGGFEQVCARLAARLSHGDMAAAQTFSLHLRGHAPRRGAQGEPQTEALDAGALMTPFRLIRDW